MKKLIIGAIFALASVSAFATPPNTGTATSTSASDAQATATNLGNNTTVSSPADTTSHVTYSGTQTLKNTPSVNGPALTTSNDTCMGTISGSVNVAGLGIGGGGTYVDTNCKRLKNARQLWNMGFNRAAIEVLCNDPDNKLALEQTGYKCGQKYVAPVAVVTPAAPPAVVVVAPLPTRYETQTLVLQGTMFALNSAELNADQSNGLDTGVAFAKAHKDAKLTIVGFTDSTGSAKYNQKLSERRARSAAAYLIGHDVDPGRITYMGMGESNPIASNKTKVGRALNRRVEMGETVRVQVK